MIGNRYSGDNLAAEFLRLVKKNASQGGVSEVHDPNTQLESGLDNSALSSPSAEDFLIKNESSVNDHAVNELENKIMDFSGAEGENLVNQEEPASVTASNSNDVESLSLDVNNEKKVLSANNKTLRILNGLGKIAGSLRGKGESFAADVVEATADSIKEESLAEARKTAFVVSELRKISNDLIKDNNLFASDLVSATVNKILKY